MSYFQSFETDSLKLMGLCDHGRTIYAERLQLRLELLQRRHNFLLSEYGFLPAHHDLYPARHDLVKTIANLCWYRDNTLNELEHIIVEDIEYEEDVNDFWDNIHIVWQLIDINLREIMNIFDEIFNSKSIKEKIRKDFEKYLIYPIINITLEENKYKRVNIVNHLTENQKVKFINRLEKIHPIIDIFIRSNKTEKDLEILIIRSRLPVEEGIKTTGTGFP